MSEDYNKWTVKQLREFCKENNINVPSKVRKADIVKIVQDATSNTESIDETQEEISEVENLDDSTKEEYVDFSKWSVSQLKVFCSKNAIKIPSKAKKAEIVALVEGIVSHPDFVDRSEEEEELEEELLAGFDEEEDPALKYKEKIDAKFWQKPEFRVLLDIELAKDSQVAFYDLSNLVDKFFNNMLKEDLINYKISGIALKSAAQLHHYKISSIIRQEEQIQKKEELEKFRERHARTIPKALPQPIQPKLQIATKDELYDAMRAAIIETMQKKEKLKRRRVRRDELKNKKKQMRSKAMLPKEILKHISGKDQTDQELHESWLNRIKATTNLNNKEGTTLFELAELIQNDEKSNIGRKFALVRLFLALMFLSTPGSSGTGKTSAEIQLFQIDEFKDIDINLK